MSLFSIRLFYDFRSHSLQIFQNILLEKDYSPNLEIFMLFDHKGAITIFEFLDNPEKTENGINQFIKINSWHKKTLINIKNWFLKLKWIWMTLVCPKNAMHLERKHFSYFSLQNRHIPVLSGFITDFYFKEN